MKKINKSKLFIKPETIRQLTDVGLARVVGGVGISRVDSGCVSCDVCPSQGPVCTMFPCITALGATCPPVCTG